MKKSNIKEVGLFIRLNKPEPKNKNDFKNEVLRVLDMYAAKAEIGRVHDESWDMDLNPMLEEIARLAECWLGKAGAE